MKECRVGWREAGTAVVHPLGDKFGDVAVDGTLVKRLRPILTYRKPFFEIVG